MRPNTGLIRRGGGADSPIIRAAIFFSLLCLKQEKNGAEAEETIGIMPLL